jgi:hypothetical protein
LALAANDTSLVFARFNGGLLQFTLSSLTLEFKYCVPQDIVPQALFLNCSGSRLAIIDGNYMLRIFELGIVKAYSGGLPSAAGNADTAPGMKNNDAAAAVTVRVRRVVCCIALIMFSQRVA